MKRRFIYPLIITVIITILGCLSNFILFKLDKPIIKIGFQESATDVYIDSGFGITTITNAWGTSSDINTTSIEFNLLNLLSCFILIYIIVVILSMIIRKVLKK